MKSTTHTEACIDVCNSLLRGELSAVETYDQTIKKFEGDPAVGVLRQIRDEHLSSADLLRANVIDMGGTPSTDSGAWGVFAKASQGVAKVFGESSALKGLQQGEDHGREEYQDALENDDVLPGCEELIRTELLPRTERHIATLKGLAKTR